MPNRANLALSLATIAIVISVSTLMIVFFSPTTTHQQKHLIDTEEIHWFSNLQPNHPELREGEVWITNADMNSFYTIGWKTKRIGITPFGSDGEPLEPHEWPGAFPVFAQKKELQKAGIHFKDE